MATRRSPQFKAELKIKPLPAAAEEYAKQYFINLVLQGFTIVGPGGASVSKGNIEEIMRAWK